MPTRAERLFEVYRQRIRRCRTENQVNKLHIELDNYLTPAEVRHFSGALVREPHGTPSRKWIARLAGFMPVGRPRPAEFERRGIFRGMTRYTADDGEPRAKTLVIGFAGFFHRLMLPTSWLLDCLNPARYDVILLRDFARAQFITGIPPLGASFFELVAGLPRHVDPRAYARAMTLGTSSGGLPALLTAIALGLDRGISLCGSDFDRFRAKLGALNQRVEPYADLLASRPQPFPALILCYGAAHEADSAAALALHALVPSRLIGVAGCAEHTVLAWALMQRALPALLASLLGQSPEDGA